MVCLIEKLGLVIEKSRKASEIISSFSGEIRVVSHHDCDGICSGAIIAKALLREGKRFRLSFVKQLTAGVIQELAGEGGRLFIFADLGSGQLDGIQKHLLKPGCAAIVLDHHQPQGEILTDRLHHINTFMMGFDDNISGSGVAYLLARTMNPGNRELSEMAVIGAIGDSQIDSIGPHWGLAGLNREILRDAIDTGRISVERGLRIWGRTTRPLHKALEYSMEPCIPGVSGSESGAVHFLQELGIPLKDGGRWRTLSELSEEEKRKLASGIIKERLGANHGNPEWVFGDVYTLAAKPEYSDASEFATLVNAAGKQDMGYLGIELCLGSRGAFAEAQAVLDNYRREIGRSLELISSGKLKTLSAGLANYVIAGDSIPEHLISNVTSIISKSGKYSSPVFSLVDADGGTKVSARLPGTLSGRINLKSVVEEAAKAVGGEGGGHTNAAGALIPRGSEQTFINSIETILTNLSKAQPAGGEDAGCNPEVVDDDGGEGSESGRETKAGEAKGRPAAGGAVERQGLVRYLGA